MNYEENLTYDWLKDLREKKQKTLSEAKIRDFVRGRSAVSAQEAGALDIDFTQSGDDYIELDPNWVSQNIVPVTLINGSTLEFHRKYADLLAKAFEIACRATGWTPENRSVGYCPRSSGGFVARRSRAKDQQGLPAEQRSIGGHAWGVNVDFGATENPYGPGTGKIRRYPAFINAMKQNGFIWGGDWSTPDDMHFEVNFSGRPPVLTPVGSGLSGDSNGSDSDSSVSTLSGGDWKDYFRNFLGSLGIKESRNKINESRIKIGKKFIVLNKSKNKDIEKNKKILFNMLKYYDDKLNFDLPVKIIFKDDEKNSDKPLGKTGYYHPEETTIVVFTSERWLKDILRSLGHELIHHKQHCVHPFEDHDTPDGYAQKDKRMRRKEKEAYLFGNLLFRDFEDNYKTNHKGVF